MSRGPRRPAGDVRRPRGRRARDREPRGEPADGLHRVPGRRAVLELLRFAPGRVDQVLAVEGRINPELADAVAAAGCPLHQVDAQALSRRAGDVEHRGVLALARPPKEVELDDVLDALVAPIGDQDGEPTDASAASAEARVVPRRVLLALDGVLDPGNLGALLRSAEFFGAVGVIWPKDRAASVTPVVVRASVGASERLPLCRVTNLARALDACKDRGAWIVGTVPEGGRPLGALLAEDALPEALVVVLGGEERGLRRLTRRRCDFLATIPGAGGVASLNVSAAGAVVLAAVTASV